MPWGQTPGIGIGAGSAIPLLWPSILAIPGSAPCSSFAPLWLLCSQGCSLPRGWECWLGGFFVSIFGNPGRAAPHPQAFGIRDGKFHLWGRYGNEQSREGGLQRERETPAARGCSQSDPHPSPASLPSTQKDPGTHARLGLAAPSPPLGLQGAMSCNVQGGDLPKFLQPRGAARPAR